VGVLTVAVRGRRPDRRGPSITPQRASVPAVVAPGRRGRWEILSLANTASAQLPSAAAAAADAAALIGAGDGGQGARAPLKFGKIIFGQIL